MSSRALRKLKGQDELEVAAEDLEEDDLLVSSQKSRRKNKNSSERSNAFDVLLNGDDDCVVDELSEDDETDGKPVNNDEKENQSSGTNNKPAARSKKKAKKKKKKGKTNDDSNVQKDEDDEFLSWESEVPSNLTGATSVNHDGMNTKPLLMIEHRNLNAENELCRKFGSRIVRGDRGRPNHRRTQRATWLINPRDNWPKVGKSGIQMKLLRIKDGYSYFAFEHTPSYQAIQFKFLDAVESMDPNNISGILSVYGYHIDSLLQLSEVCKMAEDHQMAAELVERALYCFECSFHPLFNVTQGKSRMEYKNAENRPFFLALFHHLKFVGQKGCYRTALELCKLLLSLSPDEDPLCVLLMMDFYALHSGEYDFLIRLYDEWEAHKNLSQLPNFAFSIALAHFHRSKVTNCVATADELIQKALMNFPSALMALLDKCAIALDAAMMNHPFFGIASQASESIGLKQLIALFVGRTFSEWKDPEVADWLAKNVRIVLAKVDKKDPYVNECEEKRKVRYQGTPRNIYRHIILSDIKEASTSLPVELTVSPVMSYDPLPPVDSVAGYIRPERTRRGREDTNAMAEFLRSLWPSYSLTPPGNGLEDIGDDRVHEEIPGAEGDASGNLTRGVEHLMTAMRELLNTMTYRGDLEDGRSDEEEGWE